MEHKDIRYCDTRKVIRDGEFVITTKNPSDRFYRKCSSVDKKKYVLVGVIVTGDGSLCSMDVTRRQDLESFVEGVGQTLFFKPAGGVVYKMPVRKAKKLETSYGKASITMGKNKVTQFLDEVGMELTPGIISSIGEFVPVGQM